MSVNTGAIAAVYQSTVKFILRWIVRTFFRSAVIFASTTFLALCLNALASSDAKAAILWHDPELLGSANDAADAIGRLQTFVRGEMAWNEQGFWFRPFRILHLSFEKEGFALTGGVAGSAPRTVWVQYDRVRRFVFTRDEESFGDGFIWCVSLGKFVPPGDTSPTSITLCTQEETLSRKLYNALFPLVVEGSGKIPDFFFPGIRWDVEGGRCGISSVLTGSPADAAGLKKGDVVLAVNDVAVQVGTWPPCQDSFWPQIAGKPAATLQIKASRDGSGFTTQIAVRNPLVRVLGSGSGDTTMQSGHGAWLAKIDLDAKLPEASRRNFERSIDACDALFARYGLRVPSPVTIFVTATNDAYKQALMTYANYTQQEAEYEATGGALRLGGSLKSKPLIIIRWIPTRVARGDGTSYEVNNPEDAFFALPHEVFHQVQRSFRLDKAPVWLTEGPATVFQYLAADHAGVKTFAEMFDKARKTVLAHDPLDAAVISSIVDYKQWQTLTDKRLPTYSLSTLMAARLLGTSDFGKILTFYSRVDQGGDVESAFSAAFGMTIAQFEKATNDYLREQRAH